MVQRIRRSARAERIDGYDGVPGSNAATARALGLSSGVGAPIIAEGRVWGAITVLGAGPPLPVSAEDRLEMFARLVATAIAGSQARADLAALADDQAALRRVAELVARGAPAHEIFAAVATEASRLLGGRAMTLVRYEGERELVVVASCGGPAGVGERIRFEPETLPERVRREDRVVRVDDYTRERDSALASAYGLAAALAAPISVEARVWGMLTATSDATPLPVGTEQRLQPFAELVAAALANSQARAELQALADEQSALRRIAELTAQEAPADAVLQAVAVQASRLAGVEFGMVLRFIAPDGSNEIVALDGAPANFSWGCGPPAAATAPSIASGGRGRAARIDDLGAMSGRWPQMASRLGFSTSAGVPILIQGELWGALIVAGREPMPPAIESHLADFAELVSTAISAAQARAELRVLADEQAALRRVAELVARGAALDEVFAAVATEASKLLGDLAAVLLRYDPGDVAVAVAVCNSPGPARAARFSRAANRRARCCDRGAVRVDASRDRARRARASSRRRRGRRPRHGRRPVWGALTDELPRPTAAPRTEQRLGQFAELAAAAIANAENKAKLTASRARVVATADETRRRLQRDVHDSAQQRLVHTIITLKLARDAIAEGGSAAELVEEALTNAERANAELRDVVRGILPAALTRGGLRAGLESLVADLAVPVDVHVTAPRLSTQIETTAYFIVAEALTNVVKHARATRATVEVEIEAEQAVDHVRDDGSGAADPARGTGLTGMLDRVEASEGTLEITSPAGRGTVLRASLTQPKADAAG